MISALGRRNSCAGQTLLLHPAPRSNASDASFGRSKLWGSASSLACKPFRTNLQESGYDIWLEKPRIQQW